MLLEHAVINPVVDRSRYGRAVSGREVRELLMCKPMVESNPSSIIHSETVREIEEDIGDAGLGRKTGRQ